eukprot:Clim_evm2s104 gene=Clim_evmTU2s104
MADGDVVAAATGGEAKMDVMEALQKVIKNALVADGLVRGLHECAKALDSRAAHLCILAQNIDEPAYIKLVEALCGEHKIPLIKVEESKQLGEWCGLCKIDPEGNARKVVGCGVAVIKNWGKANTAEYDVIQEYIKKNDA